MADTGYLGEIRRNWQSLLAAALGVGTGAAIGSYTNSLFAPALIAEFGWRREDYALVGTLSLVLLFVMPLAGRLTDRLGVRRVAAVGVTSMPVTFLALSMMGGDLLHYFMIHTFQIVLGTLTTTTVYSRLVAERLQSARGFGLSIIMTGPPLIAAVATPLLNALIEAHGWRAGYQALAIVSGVGGAAALLLIPRSQSAQTALPKQLAGSGKADGSARLDFFQIVGKPVFWAIAGGMFLCNLPQVIASSQTNLILLENGTTAQEAAWMLSLMALGILFGRFTFGILLDRLPANLVSAIAMALPALGFAALASPYDHDWFLAGAILFVGLAQGAEGDIAAYLVARHLGLSSYSFALGLVMSAVTAAAGLGAFVVSGALRLYGGYDEFLVFSAVVTAAGALLFLMTGGRRNRSMMVEAAA